MDTAVAFYLARKNDEHTQNKVGESSEKRPRSELQVAVPALFHCMRLQLSFNIIDLFVCNLSPQAKDKILLRRVKAGSAKQHFKNYINLTSPSFSLYPLTNFFFIPFTNPPKHRPRSPRPPRPVLRELSPAGQT